jgi:hypothetical protein
VESLVTTRTEVNELLSPIGSQIARMEQEKTKCNFEIRGFAATIGIQMQEALRIARE